MAICDNALSFDATMVVGGIKQTVELIGQDDLAGVISVLDRLHRSLKYGLPTSSSIAMYELGMSDRVVAQKLVETIGLEPEVGHRDARGAIRREGQSVMTWVEAYPAYYRDRVESILE